MFPFPSIPHWGMEQKGNIMGSSNLTSKLYEMAEKELTEFENSLDTVKKAIDAAYELSVKRDILSYIENDLPDEITDPDMQTAIENLIETGSPLAIYYDEWLHNEYDNRMEAISMTADDVYSIQQKKLLDLDHNSYCFTVISFDNNDKIAVADYVGKDDPAIYDFDEFIDYAARQNNDEVEVDASFYVVGSSGESDPPDEKQLTYINNHLEEIIREATLLESNTFTVDITEIKKEMEEDAPVYDEKYIFTMVEFETGDTYALPGIIDDNNIKGTAAWREIKNNSFNIDDVQDLDEGIKVTYDVYNADNPEAVVPTEEQLQKIIKNIGDYMLDTHSTNEGYVYAWQDCDDIISAMKQHWEEIHETAPSISDNFESDNYPFPKEPLVVARCEGKKFYNLDDSIVQIKLDGKEWLNVFDACIEMNRRGVDIKDIEMLNVRYVSSDGSTGTKDVTPEQYAVYHIRSEEHSNAMKQAIDKYNAKVQNFLEAQSKVNNDVTQFFKNKISDILLYSFSEEQISALTEAINKVPSDEGKIEIAKHFVPQEGAALYDIMCNNPIENELKIIGISPSEIVPTFNSFDNEIELMWKNVSVKLDWQEYAKACFDVAEITAAINSQIPEYTDKINDVEQIADKIQDAIDNTELNIERNEHSVSQER